ncbi:DNA topoisomerase VI subunit B [Candidatus Haloredivivus sp. G17]|nr:DNA topoisomerase VI subunit B [Candidatus Haloredivivus sp. G17]
MCFQGITPPTHSPPLPRGGEASLLRVSRELPKKSKEIKPHPHGVELGVMMRMIENSSARTITSFLQNEFTRVGRTSAEEICDEADMDTGRRPNTLEKDEIETLLKAAQNVKLQSPPTDCLSPIGEDLVLKGLKKEAEDLSALSSTQKRGLRWTRSNLIQQLLRPRKITST